MEFIAGSIARHCGIQKVTSRFVHLLCCVSICLWLCLVLSLSLPSLLSAFPLRLLPSVFLFLILFLLLIITYASVLFSVNWFP